ncbi:MAG: DEAD/DEAH box helicase [Actinomyces urogenitalis]|uniref:DEAD/DEAH box helicase n=1 Tax=Actinomyces urogenitalis TaxID=103621 RepID=UPI002911EC28|nr:DEAD/DEAH box helicase [Actinomyces urogenitalis]MDU6152155.1 DEAD/DEAH box helicase [Actinomyces urogenitalis]
MARELSPTDWPAEVTDEQIISVVGGRTFLRGQRYAEEGYVRTVSVAGTNGEIISGSVRGSGAQVYQTMVYAPQTGASGLWSGTCTCPVGANCKHCTALLLRSRALALRLQGEAGGWEEELASLLRVPARSYRRMALEVSADYYDRLTLVPLVEGKRGWNRQGASWTQVLGGALAGEVDPQVLEVLHELAGMARRSFYYADDRVSLNEMPARVWKVLRRGSEAGLTLTTAQRNGAAVIIASGLRAGAAILKESDGAVRIQPALGTEQVTELRLSQEEQNLVPLDEPAVDFQPIGAPAVHAFYAYKPGGELLLMPIEPEPSNAVRRLLADPAYRILIPAPDVPRFEAEHLEQLMRAVPVLALDEGVAVPEPTQLRAVLQVHVEGARHEASTRWLMRYVDEAGAVRREVVLGDLRPERLDDGFTDDSVTAWGGDLSGQDPWGLPEEPGLGRRPPDEVLEPEPVTQPAGQRQVPRDLQAEQRLAWEVFNALMPLVRDHGILWHRQTMRGIRTARFMAWTVPELRQLEPMELEILGEVPDYREAGQELVVATCVTEDEDRPDWFSLRVRVRVGEEEVPLERLIAAVAARQEQVLLDSGAWVDTDRPEVHRLAALMEEGRDLVEPHAKDPGQMRVTAFQAGYYSELVALGVVEESAKRWQDSVDRLLGMRQEAGREPEDGQRQADGRGLVASELVDVDPPLGLQAELRPYQLEGYRWLHLLRGAGLGGVLADDMGLGKTVQVLAEIQKMAEEPGGLTAPVLVVAPTSVIGAWAEQAAQFCPGLRVREVRRTSAKRGTSMAQEAAQADVLVTSYTLMRLDEEDLAQVEWSWVVLDEAQFIKNHTSATYKAARRLRAPSTLAITGTPLENSLMDLWSLLSVSAPGLLPGPQRFKELYKRPIDRGGQQGRDRLQALRSRMHPFMLRRTKEEVAHDLPDKSEQILRVELSPSHRRAYEARLIRERQKVMGLLEDDTAQARFSALRSLTILRQMALDPALVPAAEEGAQDDADPAAGHERAVRQGGRRPRPSAKVEMLRDTLVPIVAEGHRALVFSQFTRYLSSVREELEAAGLRTLYLDGGTSDRQRVVAQFRDGEADVFLISLKAGGFGLTLTEADYVFLLDPWWNPQAEEQAVDRAHRIGQDKPVMVYRMVAADTIEDKVMALKEKKAGLFAKVVEGSAELGQPGHGETGAGERGQAGATGAGQTLSRARLTAEEIRALLG